MLPNVTDAQISSLGQGIRDLERLTKVTGIMMRQYVFGQSVKPHEVVLLVIDKMVELTKRGSNV